MQGQLEDEQKKHSYQRHFEELKALCDRSFAEIEETHAKQACGKEAFADIVRKYAVLTKPCLAPFFFV